MQWECAHRAGTTTLWFGGDDISQLKDYAWIAGSFEGNYHAVGRKQPNPFGIHDTIGNAAEICLDQSNRVMVATISTASTHDWRNIAPVTIRKDDTGGADAEPTNTFRMVIAGRLKAKPASAVGKSNIPGWGEFINPDGASDAKEEGGRLSITVPAGDRIHLFKPGSGALPRLMQEVEGDFSAQVKVTLGRESGNDNLRSASLVAWNNDQDFHALTHSTFATNDQLTALRFLDRSRGETNSGKQGKHLIIQLKMERRGNELWTSWSRDGQTWEKTKEPVIVAWPSKVKVGVAAGNRGPDELKVQFEQFKIERKELADSP